MVIGADETVRVSYHRQTPEVETERRRAPARGRTEARNRSAESSRAGERLSKSKREERQRRQRKLRAQRIALLAGLIAGIVALCWGAVLLYRAPILPVKSITVSGARYHSADDVRRIAAVPDDATLVRLPKDDIVERLEADPWIAEATVERDFPSGLTITVRERKAAAVIDAGGEDVWLVSSDDIWLGTLAESQLGTDTAQVPLTVVDVPAIEPSTGKKVSEPEITNAVRVIEGLSDEIKAMVVTLSAPTIEETAVRTSDDVEIFIGEGEEMDTKSRIISEILSNEKNVVYINVRVTDRPTWRGLDR